MAGPTLVVDDIAVPAAPDVPRLPKKPSAAEVIHHAVATSVAGVHRHLPAARRTGSRRAVHQARVSLRRLRSDLRTFGPLVDDEWAAALRRTARHVSRQLGDVRDADVMSRLLRRGLDERPDISGDRLLRLLDEHRTQARAEMYFRLDPDSLAALWSQLDAAASDPELLPESRRRARKALRPLVREAWTTFERTVEGLGPDPDDDELHRLRLDAKRVRYASLAVEPAYGKPARKLAAAAARLQNTLGERQDGVVAAAWLEEAAPHITAADAFAAGRLTEHVQRITRQPWRRHVVAMGRRRDWL